MGCAAPAVLSLAGSFVIARRTECNPIVFVVFFVLPAALQTGGNGQGI